ncbi:MAG: hypothetical protein V4548_06560 [Bacteroidota bacterium]
MKKQLSALLFAFLLMANISYGQNFFTKAVAKIAKAMAPPAPTTANLDEVVILGGIGSNLHPKELGTMYQTFFNDWKPGGDHVAFTFMKKSGSGFLKLDGNVTVDGIPATYVTVGTYSLFSLPSTAPRKVEITTTSGQKSSFVIEPYKRPVTVVSINGQTENISLDLTKDVVIELQSAAGFENAVLKVMLAINQASIKSQYAVCYIRNTGSKITVPASAFRNINIKPAGEALYNYKKSYLSVGLETIENATDVQGQFPEVKYTRSYDDGKMVKITTEPNLNTGLVAKGKETPADGEMEYDFNKPNAFMSRPLDHMKKIGVLSFAMTGKTIMENSVITQEKDLAKGEAQTTKTTTVTFPKQTDETWNGVLNKLYPQLTAIIQSELNTTITPVEATQKTVVYSAVTPYVKEDINNESEFSTSYKGARTISSFAYSGGMSSNEVFDKLMKEAGVDGLVSFSFSLNAAKEGDSGVMIPTLNFEILGKTNGTFGTKYYSGTVTGKGVPSDNIGLKIEFSSATGLDTKGRNDKNIVHSPGTISAEELDKIIRRSDILALFAKGLKEIKDKEMANPDYIEVWNLQK